jgi:uncharacterized protein (DUF1330 family)
MGCYLLVDLDVFDPVGFEEYRQKVPATIAAHGGRYLARGGATQVLEGDWSPKRCVIVEFPDMVKAMAWWESPEYRPLRLLRERTSRANIVVTEGL